MNTATLSPPQDTAAMPAAVTTAFKLTNDQESALDAIYSFLVSPVETVFVLSGYSGCGKSTLVHTFLDNLPAYMRTARLIQPKLPDFNVQLTATTNKAAENLADITGMDVITIHSFLGLRVMTDYKTNTTKLIPKNNIIQEGCLLVIDEASWIDSEMMRLIFSRTKNCKIIFVGDPAQLIPVGATDAVVFGGKFSGAALKEVVRQAEGNPIVEFATKARNWVNSGQPFQFVPDGHHIQYLDRATFNAKILAEFTRPDWRYKDSKVLAWTNKCTINYNNMIRESAKGDPQFVVGDYAVCNSFLSINKKSIKTDQLVHITGIIHGATRHGVPGTVFTLDHEVQAFMPVSIEARNLRIKQAKAADELNVVADIDNTWVDLRAAYAQTINKSQGSTYGSVFVDLDDVGRCNVNDQLARMMYVGPSRAQHHVYFTGDLV